MEYLGAEGLEGGAGAPGVGGEAGLEGKVRQGRGEVPALFGRDLGEEDGEAAVLLERHPVAPEDESGRIKSGDLIMMATMGGGFTWSAGLVRI